MAFFFSLPVVLLFVRDILFISISPSEIPLFIMCEGYPFSDSVDLNTFNSFFIALSVEQILYIRMTNVLISPSL
jgi:hypothetical protein